MNSKYYEVRYSLISQLNEIEGERYITTYNGDIFEMDSQNDSEDLIGKITVKLLQLELAVNDEFSIYDIFDSEDFTIRIGGEIMDFKTLELNEDIHEFYNNELYNSDLCILQNIEIIETHRKKGIGKKIIKDVYNRFASVCGLFIVQTVPIQFESNSMEGETVDWEYKMKLDELEKDYEKAFYKLKAFFQNIGFDHIDGYDKFMFLSPLWKNDRLSSIKLE